MARKVNWSVVMLVSSVVTLGAVAYQAQQATQKHRATALGLLGDYAEMAVYNYAERMKPELHRLAMIAVDPMYSMSTLAAHRAFGLPTPRTHDCKCSEGMPALHQYFMYSPGRGVHGTTEFSAAAQTEIAQQIELYADSSQVVHHFVLRPLASENAVIAFRRVQNDMYVGTVMDAATLAKLFDKVSRKNLLPPSLTRGANTDTLLNLNVRIAGNAAPVYSARHAANWLAAREDTLPAQFGSLVVAAAIREDLAPSLIIGGLPRTRLPLLLLLMAITGGLAVLAIAQLRRERALVRMRESFVTSVSHELRTPLAQMQLYLDTVRMGRTSTPAERDWAMSHIARETTRLTHLVENVLHVSKPPAISNVAAPVIDLGAEIFEVVESFRPLARSRRARLVTRQHPDAMVALRAEHLRQIMLNLLDNAVKYGPLGQQVTIETSADDDWVEIRVRDEGPGVLPHERDRIWSPYFRGSTPEALASGGTGVGLSIVRELVTAYNGSVELAPSEHGACFVVRLPRVRVAPRADHAVRAAHSS